MGEDPGGCHYAWRTGNASRRGPLDVQWDPLPRGTSGRHLGARPDPCQCTGPRGHPGRVVSGDSDRRMVEICLFHECDGPTSADALGVPQGFKRPRPCISCGHAGTGDSPVIGETRDSPRGFGEYSRKDPQQCPHRRGRGGPPSYRGDAGGPGGYRH